MRLSQSFTKTLKNAPAEETSVNAQLLIRGGFIHKVMAGVYEYLPLGLRVLNNVTRIIREEMNAIGAQELSLTALQDPEVWKTTGRWDDAVLDVWFKTELKNGSLVGLATTHEDPLTSLMTNYISSYRDLPVRVYQFQTKFRNELRAKNGILRAREFLMKDLYSFSKDLAQHEEFYAAAKDAYYTIFKRIGIGEHVVLTFASGGSFSKYSHEFQAVSEAGEDTIYLDKAKGIAVNKEVYTDEVLENLELNKDDMEEVRAIEVGNIFTLGTRFSEPLGLAYNDEHGAKHPVVMGSYGIGPGRVMGTVVELSHDDTGIIWPAAIAPFRVHLVSINQHERAEKVYRILTAAGIDTLYDDRDDTGPGAKFADADLIGCPVRLTIGGKTPEGKIEFKRRTEKDSSLVDETELIVVLE